jgi:ferritin-like metal-binding protein YciE
LIGKVADLLHAAHDDYDKTTQNLIKAYGTDHLEMGMYAALAAYSRAYGDHETAMLAEGLMAEEKASAEQARPLIASCAADTFAASVRKAA